MTRGVESSFHEIDAEKFSGINFDMARRLNIDSATYDFYVAEVDSRKLFVKRLKNEYRTKPFYRSALKKEFEIGRTLHHASLPSYVGFFGDYVAMDFVEGKSLSKLMSEGSVWLKDERNVAKLLGQLIETVEYLHRHNVVHCDIRAANVMITSMSGNVVLVDFDKCFTDWFDKTSGSASVYGVDETQRGSVQIDFNGIGLLVEQLCEYVPKGHRRKYKRIAELCRSANRDADAIVAELNSKSVKRYVPYYVSSLIVVAVLGVGAVLLTKEGGNGEGGNGDDGVERLPEIVGEQETATVGAGGAAIDTIEREPAPALPAAAEKAAVAEGVKADNGRATGAYDDVIENELSVVAPLLVNAELIVESADQIPNEKKEGLARDIDNEYAGAIQKIRRLLKELDSSLTDESINAILSRSQRYRSVSQAKERLVGMLLKHSTDK